MSAENEKRLNVRLPESEHTRWVDAAADRGLTISALIRSAMAENLQLRKPRKPQRAVYKPVNPELLAALARIGNNVNQLARHANECGDLPTLVALAAIERELKRLADAG